MKLFYVTASNKYNENKNILIEELDSEYDSSCIDTDLTFTENPDLSWHKNKIALFSSEEIEILMAIKNKTIPWGSDLKLRGMSVLRFNTLFSYMDNVQIKEVNIDF